MNAAEIYLKEILDTLQGGGGIVVIGGSLPAGNNNIGDVDVLSIVAGETHIGEIGGKLNVVSVEFTRPANNTPYSIGDAILNAAGTLVEVPLFARINGGSGYIFKIRIAYNTKSVTPQLCIHFFNASNPTIAADNVNWKDLYADESKRIGNHTMPNPLSTAQDAANSNMSSTEDNDMVRFAFQCVPGTRSIWIALETLTAFTPVSGDKFTLKFHLDLY